MSKNNDFTDECGSAPLNIAPQEGHLEVVQVLLKFGASIDSQCRR
jgi:ankyrin repeat protein